MTDKSSEPAWAFHTFGLLVTGRGEEDFIPSFLRSLASAGDCTFKVVRRVGQRSPRTSKKKLKMTGSDKAIPDLDAQEIGLPARNFLTRHPDSFVILLADLEHSRREIHHGVFNRYRAALDGVLKEDLRHRASVHFLVNMLEAYYFAHAEAVNEALGVELEGFEGDVEDIRNPKGDLKKFIPNFDEIADGRRIVSLLDMEHVLGNPETCASLRTLFKWCIVARAGELTDRFHARSGICSPITSPQLAALTARRSQVPRSP
jgi:hypothetical protein